MAGNYCCCTVFGIACPSNYFRHIDIDSINSLFSFFFLRSFVFLLLSGEINAGELVQYCNIFSCSFWIFFSRQDGRAPRLRLGDGPMSALSTVQAVVRGVEACREWVKGANALTEGRGLDGASSHRLVQVRAAFLYMVSC